MFEEIRKSIQLILHERITSPFSGAVIFSWFIWNWKIPYYLIFSDNTLTLEKRIKFVEDHYFNYTHNLFLPIASALFLILLYPFITTGAISVWLRFKQWQNSIKNEIEGNQLLTIEQSVEIKMQMRRQRNELADLIKSRDEEIEILRRENSELQEQLNPKSKIEDESEEIHLSENAKKILIEAAQDENGMLHVMEFIGGWMIRTHNIAFGEKATPREVADLKAAVRELQSNDFLDSENDSLYKVTNRGYKYADKLRGVA